MSITTSSRNPREIALQNYDVRTADGKPLEVIEDRIGLHGEVVVTHLELPGFRWSYSSPVGRSAVLQTIRTEVDIVRYAKLKREPYDVVESDLEIVRKSNANRNRKLSASQIQRRQRERAKLYFGVDFYEE